MTTPTVATHPFVRSEHHAGCAECGQTPVAAVHDWLSQQNPNRCPICKGIGLKVREVPTTLYSCGFYTQAYTCPSCLGTGHTMPHSIAQDHKAAAAGDR